MLKEILTYYVLGVILTTILVGGTYLFWYFTKNPYLSNAEPLSTLITIGVGGFCFGVAIWIFKKYKEQN